MRGEMLGAAGFSFLCPLVCQIFRMRRHVHFLLLLPIFPGLCFILALTEINPDNMLNV